MSIKQSESVGRYWGQRSSCGRRYGNGGRGQQKRATGGSTTQTQTYYTTPKGRTAYRGLPSRRIGGKQGDDNGNGGDKGDKDKKKYSHTMYDPEEKDEEESDTEDSFDFEITPQQLSQVTPGGGVLKLTVIREGTSQNNNQSTKQKTRHITNSS